MSKLFKQKEKKIIGSPLKNSIRFCERLEVGNVKTKQSDKLKYLIIDNCFQLEKLGVISGKKAFLCEILRVLKTHFSHQAVLCQKIPSQVEL